MLVQKNGVRVEGHDTFDEFILRAARRMLVTGYLLDRAAVVTWCFY
jgi:hypothetical protein